MPTPVSGHIARLYLLTLQEIAGPQYLKILQQAGWGRYSSALPPASDEMAATVEEGRQMTQVIYAMLGEDLFRLFSRNVGTTLMRMLLAGYWAGLPAQAAQIPLAQRPRWVMEQQ